MVPNALPIKLGQQPNNLFRINVEASYPVPLSCGCSDLESVEMLLKWPPVRKKPVVAEIARHLKNRDDIRTEVVLESCRSGYQERGGHLTHSKTEAKAEHTEAACRTRIHCSSRQDAIVRRLS
jgi:hypothetical protein